MSFFCSVFISFFFRMLLLKCRYVFISVAFVVRARFALSTKFFLHWHWFLFNSSNRGIAYISLDLNRRAIRMNMCSFVERYKNGEKTLKHFAAATANPTRIVAHWSLIWYTFQNQIHTENNDIVIIFINLPLHNGLPDRNIDLKMPVQ